MGTDPISGNKRRDSRRDDRAAAQKARPQGLPALAQGLSGIEPTVILKYICGASDRETEAVVRWMMDALVDTALRQAK
jgi:hypothetical protein